MKYSGIVDAKKKEQFFEKLKTIFFIYSVTFSNICNENVK